MPLPAQTLATPSSPPVVPTSEVPPADIASSLAPGTVLLERLSAQESIIEQKLNGFADVGKALGAIRSERLYRASGFSSFDAYCTATWAFGAPRAYQFIQASEVLVSIDEAGLSPLPTRESHARPLAPLNNEKRVEAWRAVLVAHEAGEPITARLVNEAVADLLDAQEESGSEAFPAGIVIEAPEEYDGARIASDGFFVDADFGSNEWDEQVRRIRSMSPPSTPSYSTFTEPVAKRAWSPVSRRGATYSATLIPQEPAAALRFSPAALELDPPGNAAGGDAFIAVCPGVDLFAEADGAGAVPDAVLDLVFEAVEEAADWRFVFLTSHTDRLLAYDSIRPIPRNAFVGLIAQDESNASSAELTLGQLHGGTPWLLVERLNGPLDLTEDTPLRWLVIGTKQPRGIPYAWMEIAFALRDAGLLAVQLAAPLAHEQWPLPNPTEPRRASSRRA